MVDASSWYEYVLMLPDSIAVPEIVNEINGL